MRDFHVRPVLATAVIAVAAAASTASAASAPAAPACGKDWKLVRSPSPGEISSTLLDVAAVSAAGVGEAWSVGFRSYLDDDDLYAVSPIIEHWDGAAWSVAYRLALQGQLAGIFALATDDIWAVGHTGLESPDYQPLIMHWDGAAWRDLASPDAAMGYLTAVGGNGPDDLWAAGTLIGPRCRRRIG